MPGKKKKFNSRFPPARIKKIMQTDEEVGKVAAAVPVIISRGLELFVKSLLTRAGEITTARHARTLTPAHLKQCIMADKRFDFLQELVASVADITGDGESDAGPPTPNTPLTPVINFPLQGSALHPMLIPPPASPSILASHDNTTPLTIPVSAGDSGAEVKSPRGRGRGRSRGRGRGRGQPQGAVTGAASGGRGERRPRGRPRKVIQPLHTVEEPDSDDGLSLNVDTDQEEQDSDTDEEEEEEEEITPMDYSSNSQRTKPSIASPGVSHPEAPCNVRFTEGTPKVAGLQISVGGGLSLGLPSETGNKGTLSPSTALPSFKIGQSPAASPSPSTALPSFKIGQSPAASPSPSTALPSFKIGQSPATSPSPSTALPSFKIGQSPAASPSPSTALPSFKIGQSPAASPSPSIALPSCKIGQNLTTSPSPSTALPSFKIGQSPTASPPLVHPSATTSSSVGIHITIPGLPTSRAMVPGGGTPPVTISPVRLPYTPVTPGVKPSFGVPVPVITSIQSVQNRPQLSIAYAPSATSLHSQHSANNDIDEDYDS